MHMVKVKIDIKTLPLRTTNQLTYLRDESPSYNSQE